MIHVDHLTKCFGDFTAVDGLCLEVNQGEILALLGPNGAGKTTTVRMLSGILPPTAGRATVGGYDIVSQAQEVRHIAGLLTEAPGLYSRMNPVDYLDFFGRLQGMPASQRRARIEELLHLFGLWEHRHTCLGGFSKGMRQKMALCRALLHNPQVLFLDEPTSSLDPSGARLVRDHIRALKQQGRTILVCTHNLAEAEALADRIAIIHQGRLVAIGTPKGLRRDLLGQPSYELRLAAPERYIPLVAELAQVESWDDHCIRYYTPHPERVNPLLLERLVSAQAQVVSLAEVNRSLEEAYLRIVGHTGSQTTGG